jgi:hypothetical protein
MGCRKWEEAGLLYTAQELTEQEKGDYEAHLKSCDECRNEISLYRSEQKRFFTPELLGDAPSEKVSAEILRVCSNQRSAKAQSVGFNIFSMSFLRKAFMPAALFIIGFISVGYITMNMENARAMKTASLAAHKAPVSGMPAMVAQNTADSSKDSLHNPDVNFARTRGNLDDKGVITVDLKK